MTQTTCQIRNTVLDEKMEVLIAIGAATASNCIPCFEHLYEKAVACGLTADQIKRASDIATQVKAGAHSAISNSINELIGEEKNVESCCKPSGNKSCCSG